MKSVILAAAAVAGLALTADTADAQYRIRSGYGHRGGYVAPVYSNGFVIRQSAAPTFGRTFNGGAFGQPFGTGFYPAFGNPYPQSSFGIGFGTGGFNNGFNNGFGPGFNRGFNNGFNNGFGGYRRW